jgi:hypothetical protein
MLEKRVAIAVDVLDFHRGDYLAELAEDDFLGLLADVRFRRAGESPRSSSVGLCADRHCKHAGHVTRMFIPDSRDGFDWIGSGSNNGNPGTGPTNAAPAMRTFV